jgi:hypothetical protein
MIDIKNGSIALQNFMMRKGLTKDDFLSSNLFGEVLKHQEYEFTTYSLKPQLIEKEKFIMVIYFNKNDIIDLVNLSLSNSENLPSWDNWSESEEQRKKEEHDKWLLNKIGIPPYNYDWGTVSSNYDPRSGSSMITIRYNN